MNGTDMIDLASERLGGRALAASDEFFAPKENLLKPGPAVFIDGKFTSRGKWMDGWETRRRRTPGHDWCVVRLGLRGILRRVDVDTSFFVGNGPESVSLEAADLPGKIRPGPAAAWTELIKRVPVKGGVSNILEVADSRPWTHLRLNIFPDGGVARLRARGIVVPDWARLLKSRAPLDLAAIEHGGLVIAQSDMFFGRAVNLLMPGRARNMGEGWETKRRRGPGYDWCVIRLGRPGTIARVEVDTNHFKGNYPESFSLEAASAPAEAAAADIGGWTEIIARAKLKPHARQFFDKIKACGDCSHVRLNIFPDGGVSRLRIHGRPRQA